MAPEQARGEVVTERADVYAAALLAWRLATGRTPFARFKDDEIELLRAMRNPRLRPLSALRPDLPEPVLTAITRALEPDATKRTITADELRATIRASIEVDAGHVELAELLQKWRAALLKTVVRDDSSARERDGDGNTSRYEEAALAFDEGGAMDGPTFETYSLPSDAAILATLPVDGVLEVSMPPAIATSSNPPAGRADDSGPPPPPPAKVADDDDSPPSSEVRDAARAMRSRGRTRLALAIAVLAIAVCAVALLMTR
jgi:hypothetical protein